MRSRCRAREITQQFRLQLPLHTLRADDADMRYPVAHDGQHLIGVADLGRDDQPPVFQFLFDDLVGDELAALEIAGDQHRYLEDDLLLFFAQPDAVFLRERFVDGGVGFELGIQQPKVFDLAEGKGLEPIGIAAGEVPDAFVIDQLVWGDAGVLLRAFVFPVIERDVLARDDGLLQLPKCGFLAGEVFVMVALDQQGRLDAGIEDVAQEVVGERGEQAAHAGQAGEPFDVAGAELAEKSRVEVIAAAGLDERQIGEAFVEVALDGAQIDAEFVGQRLGVELLTLIQLDQHLRQSIHKGVVVGGFHGMAQPTLRNPPRIVW